MTKWHDGIPSECAQCKPWNDGMCDFGCPCDDCKPQPWAHEQVAAFYRGLVPLPACGNEECNGDDCGPCAQAAYYDQLEHERAHSAARLG
jgi:hypothetical protein